MALFISKPKFTNSSFFRKMWIKKQHMGGSGEKIPWKDMEKKKIPQLSNLFWKFTIIIFFNLKTQPIGAWKAQCAQF